MSTKWIKLSALSILILAVVAVLYNRQGSQLDRAIARDDAVAIQSFNLKPEHLNWLDSNGHTPLMRATLQGRIAAMSALLAKGADPNVPCSGGETALMITWENPSTSTSATDILLKGGADPNRADARGMTAFMVAVSSGRPDLALKMLNFGADVNAKDKSGQSALNLVAVSANSPVLVQAMLDRGADPNSPDIRGATPLMLATGRGNIEVMKILLAGGANLEARNNKGEPVIFYAANFDQPAALQVLISAGADINATDKMGNQVISVAMGRRSKGCQEILCSLGVKIPPPNRSVHVGNRLMGE